MLAAAIGIDRAVEGDVGRLVARDDLARPLDLHLGLERRQLFERAPLVVERLDDLRLVAPGNVGLRTAPAPPVGQDVRLFRPVGPAPAQAGTGLRDGVGETTCGGYWAVARRNSTYATNYDTHENVARTNRNIFVIATIASPRVRVFRPISGGSGGEARTSKETFLRTRSRPSEGALRVRKNMPIQGGWPISEALNPAPVGG